MADTLFADVSSWQCVVNDSYPHDWFSFRSNNGQNRDPNFGANWDWSVKAVKSGKIVGFHVYLAWEDGDVDGAVSVHKSMINSKGGPSAMQASMMDAESWGGAISGNHSSSYNSARENLISFYGGNRKRVFAYANQYDRQNLWPSYGDAKWIIANYSTNPKLADQIAHQYGDDINCKPFGPCDGNSADGMSPQQFAAALGLTGAAPSGDRPGGQLYLYTKSGQVTKLAKAGTWYTVGWDADLANTGGSSLVLPDSATIFEMSAWLYTSGLTPDDNLYWRVQTLDRNGKELAKYPVAEVRGTTGDSDLAFKQVGSVNKKTNLRILASSTRDNVSITSAWWRCLYW